MYSRLNAEWTRREDQEFIAEINRMTDLYRNVLPPEYDKFFPRAAPKHVVGMVKLAWNDLATSIGRIPDLRMDALNETTKEEKRVGLLERVSHGYLRRAEPSGKQFMWGTAWWLVGAGRAVTLVHPGVDKQGQPTPILSRRDPRHCAPNMRTVDGVPVEVYDLLFKYKIPRLTAEKLGLADESEQFGGVGAFQGKADEVTVCEFIDDEAWTVVAENGRFVSDDHGLGIVPGWVYQSFNPSEEGTGGLSLFADQLTFQVAISMLMSLKLAAADRNVNPVYWAKGHVGSVKIGPNTLNKLSPNGEIGVLTPPNLIQVDKDIEQLMQLSRILNRNPESRQGEVQAKGTYQSAKTLEQLSEAIDTVIGQYWDLISVGMQHMFHAALAMDDKLWPDVERHITTNVKNRMHRDTYTPSRDIDGRYHINVEYGFGVTGYQGFLMNLQAHGAKMKSRKTVMEDMPGVSDVDKELREIEIEGMDEAGMVAMQTQAGSGQLDVVQWAKMREGMASGGKMLHEVVVEMEEEIREQAQQSVEQGGADALTVAPGQAPATAPQEAELPGLPPPGLV